MSDRFHQAAKDGYLELLKQATKKDLNQKGDGGMTPTLWAAYHGNLEALRLCCKRGGDPDKCDYSGNTALHFVSANGHIDCLMFLVSFGANIWQMDNDYHTIMDVAAIREKQDCIKYLDAVIIKQKSLDKKKVAGLQARAKKDAEKRIKVYERLQLEQQKKLSKMHMAMEQPTTAVEGATRKKKVSVVNMQPSTYSEATSIKPMPQRKISKQMSLTTLDDGFRVSEGGRRMVNPINGVPSNVQSDVLFQRPQTMSLSGQTQVASKRKNLRNVFPERQQSGPENGMGDSERSVFGTMALRTTFGLADSMNSAAMDAELKESDTRQPAVMGGFNGTGSFSSPTGVSSYQQAYESEDDEDFMNGLVEPSELKTFLESLGLSDFWKIFKEQQMDMEALMRCGEEDLKELGLVMGPRKKIMNALMERNAALKGDADNILTSF